MDQVTLAKKQMRADNWRGLIQECQQSGQMVIQWCQPNNIKTKTYYYWLQLRTQALAETALAVPVQAPKQSVAFKQLEAKSPVTNTWAVVIIHLPQATLEITEGTSQQAIQPNNNSSLCTRKRSL